MLVLSTLRQTQTSAHDARAVFTKCSRLKAARRHRSNGVSTMIVSRRSRYCRFKKSTVRMSVSQSQLSAEFLDALPDASDTNAYAVWAKRRDVVTDALPVVLHGNQDLLLFLRHDYRAISRKTAVSSSGVSLGKSDGFSSMEVSIPLRLVSPSEYQQSAACRPISSSKGGCNKCDTLRTC
jgi:hypothetical protein